MSSQRWKELFDQNVGAQWRDRREVHEQGELKHDNVNIEPSTPEDDEQKRTQYEDIAQWGTSFTLNSFLLRSNHIRLFCCYCYIGTTKPYSESTQ